MPNKKMFSFYDIKLVNYATNIAISDTIQPDTVLVQNLQYPDCPELIDKDRLHQGLVYMYKALFDENDELSLAITVYVDKTNSTIAHNITQAMIVFFKRFFYLRKYQLTSNQTKRILDYICAKIEKIINSDELYDTTYFDLVLTPNENNDISNAISIIQQSLKEVDSISATHDRLPFYHNFVWIVNAIKDNIRLFNNIIMENKNL